MMSVAGLVMALAVVMDDAVVGAETTRRRLPPCRRPPSPRETLRPALSGRNGDQWDVCAVAVAALIAGVSVVPLLVLDGVQAPS